MVSNMDSLISFGYETRNLRFKDNWDWFVRTFSVGPLWQSQPTYLLSQCVFLLGALVTLIHALSRRGRWPWLWLAALLHGLVTEGVSYFVPEIDNFWHSQTPVVFLGGRLPLHIAFLYPLFYYIAINAVSRLQLPRWSEPFAMGLAVVLIDIPYDVIGVKFVHWTWHDTDPNIGDRFYWVPWNSFFFHATFSASFLVLFHLFADDDKWKYRGFFRELKTTVVTSLFSMPLAILWFIVIYHPLHDLYKVHSEVTFFIIFVIFLGLAWSGDRTPRERTVRRLNSLDWALVLLLVYHYLTYLGIAIFGKPQNEISVGLHEPVGPCGETVSLRTFSGTTVTRRKYLCPTRYNEDYFTFSCLPGGKLIKNTSVWYTICGTPFRNHCEFVAVVGTLCLVAFFVFYNCYFRSNYEIVSKAPEGVQKKKTKQH